MYLSDNRLLLEVAKLNKEYKARTSYFLPQEFYKNLGIKDN